MTAFGRFADDFRLSSLSKLLDGARAVVRATFATAFVALTALTTFCTGWRPLIAASTALAPLPILGTFATALGACIAQRVATSIARRVCIAIISIATVVAIRTISTLAAAAR